MRHMPNTTDPIVLKNEEKVITVINIKLIFAKDIMIIKWMESWTQEVNCSTSLTYSTLSFQTKDRI